MRSTPQAISSWSRVAVDPDPTEYLLPSMEMKREDQQKPYVPNFHLLNMLSNWFKLSNFVPRYDTKKSVWIMDAKTHAYKEGLLV